MDHRDGEMRQSFTIQLDSKFRSAVGPDVGQGCPVPIRNLERTPGSSGNQDASHHLLATELATLNRTASKEDLCASSAELVYDYPLTVPGNFVKPKDDQPTPSQALSQLRETVPKLLLTPTSPQNTKNFSLPLSFATSPYVFVRKGGTQAPLQRPYEVLFRVIEHRTKTFKLEKRESYGDRVSRQAKNRKPTSRGPSTSRRGRPPRKKILKKNSLQ